MREKKYYVALTPEERTAVVDALIFRKNQLIRAGRYTDAVDELLLKVIRCRLKKFKVTEP